jgi:hypothetical protein
VTIGLLPELMGPSQKARAVYLDHCRRMRNEADYDRVGVVTSADAAELLGVALAFRSDVVAWLGREHPELV